MSTPTDTEKPSEMAAFYRMKATMALCEEKRALSEVAQLAYGAQADRWFAMARSLEGKS